MHVSNSLTALARNLKELHGGGLPMTSKHAVNLATTIEQLADDARKLERMLDSRLSMAATRGDLAQDRENPADAPNIVRFPARVRAVAAKGDVA